MYLCILVALKRSTQNVSSETQMRFSKTWTQNVVDCVDQIKYFAAERNQHVISKRKSG